MSGGGYGPVMDIVVGIVGAILGGFIMRSVGFAGQVGHLFDFRRSDRSRDPERCCSGSLSWSGSSNLTIPFMSEVGATHLPAEQSEQQSRTKAAR